MATFPTKGNWLQRVRQIAKERKKRLESKKKKSIPKSQPKTSSMSAGSIFDRTTPGSVKEKVEEIPKEPTTDITPPPQVGYTHGTGTVEEITGKAKGYSPPSRDKGFYRPDVVKKRKEEMDLKKQHLIGRDSSGRPVHAPVTETQYQHGYTPGVHDPVVRRTYDKLEDNLQKSINIVNENIVMINKAEEHVDDVKQFINQLENAKSGTTVTYTEVLPSGEEVKHEDVSVSVALTYFRGHLNTLQEYVKELPEQKDTRVDLQEQEKIISGYKKLGYALTKTDDGYEVGEPDASKVYLWKHGEMSTPALISTAFLASPLGVQTVGAAIQYYVTGEEKVYKAELERLSKTALGLDVAIRKGEYVGRVVTSPAMVEGVYLPVATFGASKLISTGVSAASPYIISGVGKTSATLTKVLGHLPSKLQTVISVSKEPIKFAGAKGLQLLGTRTGRTVFKYGLYFGLEGREIIKTPYQEMGGRFARSLFRYELQWAAMEAGIKGTKFHTKKWVEKDIFKSKNIPESVQKQYVSGKLEIYHKPGPIETRGEYRAFGESLIKTEGKKPVEVYFGIKGYTKTYPNLQYTESIGAGKFSWVERKGFQYIEHTSFRPVYSSSKEIITFGKARVIKSTEMTMGKIEPYVGESFTGAIKLKDTGKFTMDFFVSKGKYSNIIEDIIGEHRFVGMSYGLKGTGGKSLDLGSQLTQEVTSITKTAPTLVGIKITISKPLQYFGAGLGAAITKEVTRKPTVVTKDMSITKTDVIQDTKVKTKPIVVTGMKTKQLLDSKKDKKTRVITTTKTSLESITRELPIATTGQRTIQETKELYDPAFLPGMGQTQMQEQRQMQRLGLKSLSLSETETLQLTDVLAITEPSVFELITPLPIIPLGTTRSDLLVDTKKKKKGTGYNVYVKERSMYHRKITKPTRFTKRNPHALTKEDALSLGATIADETPAISFKVKPTKEKPTESLVTTKSFKEIGHKFRKKGDVFIEKNKFRLDSPGEQRGISELGRLSRKQNLLSGKKKKKKKKGKKNVRYI